MKVSPKIKTSTHSANHHLSPAFHVLFQLCVYLRCTVALKKEPQRCVTPIFQFQDTDNTPVLSRSHVEEAFCQTRSTPEPVTKQNRRGGGSRRCPLRCSEPSNYTNLQEAVLITRNPEDVKTSSAGGLVLTTNGGKKQKQNGGLVIIINALTVTADPIIHS